MLLKKVPFYTATVITIVIILGLWTTGVLSLLNPVEWRWLALSGYAFPVFIIATVGLLIAWTLLRQWRLIFITVIGLIVAYMPVNLYCPIHTETDVPDDAIQLMTYNTENWGRGNEGDADRQNNLESVLNYIVECNPDIVCLQESTFDGNVMPLIDSIIKPKLQYVDFVMCDNGSQRIIFSRYPIQRKEQIKYESQGNSSAAFWISVHGKEVIVISNHLQSMLLSVAEKTSFSEMVHGEQERDSMKHTSHTIFGKILDASCKRAPQAEAVARFIRMHKRTPMIVCGDFNDLPLSYTHRTVAKELTDCYQATGSGPGFSFAHYGMRVRIDNILCSEHFLPYNCFVDKSIGLSDHYPMRCWLKMN